MSSFSIPNLGYLGIISGVPKFGFSTILHQNKGFRGVSVRKMAWSLEKCNKGIESNSSGIVRPATEAYADEAIKALRTGKVIAVPTDTLYGFACDAW